MATLSWQIILSAFLGCLACILCVLATFALYFHKKKESILANIEQLVDQRIKEEALKFGNEIEQRVKIGVSHGITQGVSSIPSTEVLKKTHKTITKTGREIVGNGIQSIFGRKPATDQAPKNEPEIAGDHSTERPPY